MYVSEALKGMEKVAEHINEMQRIHEEYGAIFDHLFRQHQKSCKQVSNIIFTIILCISNALSFRNSNIESRKCVKMEYR